MEPFSVHCTTCRARLRVRKQEAIGQIFGCPKCGGMVLIQRPAESGPVPDASPESTRPCDRRVVALTDPARAEAAYEMIHELFGGKSDRGATLEGGDSGEHSGFRRESPTDGIDSTHDQPTLSTAAWRDSDEEPAGESDEGMVTKPRTRSFALILLSGGFGIALAIGCFGLISRQQATAIALGLTDENATEARPASDSPDSADEGSSHAKTIGMTNRREINTRSVPSNDSRSATDVPGTAAPGAEDALSDLQPLLRDADATPLSEDLASERLDSERRHTVEKVFISDLRAESPEATRGGPPADEIRSLEWTVDEERSESPAERRVVDQMGAISPWVHPSQSALPPLPLRFREMSEVPPPREPIPPIDADAMLAESAVVKMKWDAEFEPFLNLVSQISTVPITIMPDSLKYTLYRTSAGMQPVRLSSHVRIRGTDATTADLLHAGLGQLRLDYLVSDGHVVVNRAATLDGNQEVLKHDVRDLVTSGTSPERLVSMVTGLVAPRTWTDVGGTGKIMIKEGWIVLDQTDEVHHEALFLFEKMRGERGLPLEGRFPRDMTNHDWRAAASTLNRVIPAVRESEQSLHGLLHEIDQSAGPSLRILVDWHALAPTGWAGSSRVTFSSGKQPLRETLDALRRQFLMVYYSPLPDLICLTSRDAAADIHEVAIHPIDDLILDGAIPAALVEELESAIGVEHFHVAGGGGAIIYEPVDQSLYVRLPQADQAAIDWLLGQLRAGS